MLKKFSQKWWLQPIVWYARTLQSSKTRELAWAFNSAWKSTVECFTLPQHQGKSSHGQQKQQGCVADGPSSYKSILAVWKRCKSGNGADKNWEQWKYEGLIQSVLCGRGAEFCYHSMDRFLPLLCGAFIFSMCSMLAVTSATAAQLPCCYQTDVKPYLNRAMPIKSLNRSPSSSTFLAIAKDPNPLRDSVLCLGLTRPEVWWPVLPHIQTVSDGRSGEGDGFDGYNTLADTSTDEENTISVALFSKLRWTETPTYG